jgi:hypothetical protein
MEKLFDVTKNFVGPENFLDPQNRTLTEIFLATGGGSLKLISSTNNFFGTGRAQSEKVGQISFRPPNFFLPVRPWTLISTFDTMASFSCWLFTRIPPCTRCDNSRTYVPEVRQYYALVLLCFQSHTT